MAQKIDTDHMPLDLFTVNDKIVLPLGWPLLAPSFAGLHFTQKFKRFLRAFCAAGGVKSSPSIHSEREMQALVLERRMLTPRGVYFNGVIYSSPDLMKLRPCGRMSVSLLIGRDPFCPRSLVVLSRIQIGPIAHSW